MYDQTPLTVLKQSSPKSSRYFAVAEIRSRISMPPWYRLPGIEISALNTEIAREISPKEPKFLRLPETFYPEFSSETNPFGYTRRARSSDLKGETCITDGRIQRSLLGKGWTGYTDCWWPFGFIPMSLGAELWQGK